jgi:hypothetical protein
VALAQRAKYDLASSITMRLRESVYAASPCEILRALDHGGLISIVHAPKPGRASSTEVDIPEPKPITAAVFASGDAPAAARQRHGEFIARDGGRVH